MAVLATISLHDAGRRLAELHGSREQVACGRLLGLLKTGQINAGFQFPAGSTLSWIAIPAHYWAKVSSNKFKIIRYSKTSPKSGALTVRLSEFAEEVVTQLNEAPGREQAASDKWKEVLAATSHRYEVVIIEADWINYLNQHNLTEPGPEIESKSGRNQKKGWRDVSVIIGAYIIKHYEKTKEEIKAKEASEKIHEIAKAGNIIDLPSASTIKDELSKIKARAETLSIK
jgi:hypothetical protein